MIDRQTKKKLEEYFNTPKSIARWKRIDRNLTRHKVERLHQEILDREQEEKNARRMIWAVVIVVILAFHLAG